MYILASFFFFFFGLALLSSSKQRLRAPNMHRCWVPLMGWQYYTKHVYFNGERGHLCSKIVYFHCKKKNNFIPKF